MPPAARSTRRTALHVEVRALVDVIDSIERDDDGRVRHHYTLVDVFAESAAGDPVAGDDAAEAAWFDVDEIAGLGLWSETLRVIGLAAAKRKAG